MGTAYFCEVMKKATLLWLPPDISMTVKGPDDSLGQAVVSNSKVPVHNNPQNGIILDNYAIIQI
jgi:hypothetical protein